MTEQTENEIKEKKNKNKQSYWTKFAESITFIEFKFVYLKDNL